MLSRGIVPQGNVPRTTGDTDPAGLRGRVYVAAPLTTYGTARYERLCILARDAFPRATLLPARDCFTSHADWRSRWKEVLRGCAAVAFVTDEGGSIGCGVWDELTFSRWLAVPIWLLADDGRLTPCERVCFTLPDAGDWRHYSRVVTPAGAGGAP